jgi:hypothetical protein
MQVFDFLKPKTVSSKAPKYEPVTIRSSFAIPTVLLGAHGSMRSAFHVPATANFLASP